MSRSKTSNKFLKENIADAFIELLSTKSLNKITIDEITDKAKVGRVSYFRNFNSKQELISFKLISLWNKFADENNIVVRDRYDAKRNALLFFKFNYNIRDLLRTIYKSNMNNAVFEAFTTTMISHNTIDAKIIFTEKFYAYGLYGLLDEWIRHDFKETPEQIAKIVQEIK